MGRSLLGRTCYGISGTRECTVLMKGLKCFNTQCSITACILRLLVISKVYNRVGVYQQQLSRTMLKSIEREVSFMAIKDVVSRSAEGRQRHIQSVFWTWKVYV